MLRRCLVTTGLTCMHLSVEQGNALSGAGLDHAEKYGSEATTVMSARQCGVFRRGLAKRLEVVNSKLVDMHVQIRRFQVIPQRCSHSQNT